ncbi:Upstream stimulatory factor 1 [Mucor circinelloides]
MSTSPTTTTNNKRKSSVRDEEKTDQTSKRQATETSSVPVSTAAVPPPLVALPPPLMQYPNGQFVSVVHHPHQQPYYHMYHPQQPIYYPISPQQHPFLSPTMPPTQEASSAKKSSTPRILPKSPESPGIYPHQQQQSPMSPFYHPYSIQMSPTLMPSPYVSSRQNSISSSPGLGPSNAVVMNTTNTATTADQREKARKVSHSAIERRRRERINDKILQLKQLIPSCVEQDNLHKMSILQSAIDYISYLKEIVKKLDEKSGGDELLKGDHLKVKMQKSMLPKEVEPFTNQFSVHQNKPATTTKTQESRRSDLVVVEHQKGLKPMDIIKSGTPIISTGTTPLTPPQEPQQDGTTATSFEPTISRSTTLSSSSSSSSSTDESKHMSLQNILC